MATVVTVDQLSQVSQAQKNYIDKKDSDLKKELQQKIDGIVIPGEATEAEISGILDIFKTDEAAG